MTGMGGLESSTGMAVSCESSDCETAWLNRDVVGLSPFTTKAGIVERSRVLSETKGVGAPFCAPCLLRSNVVTFSPDTCALALSFCVIAGDSGMSERGIAPQRLTLTVILPMERGMMGSNKGLCCRGSVLPGLATKISLQTRKLRRRRVF